MSTDVEERVRRALAGRAAQITPGRLRPAMPPTAAPGRRRWLPGWRSLLVVAAVLVAVVFVVRRPGDVPPPQVPNAPAVTVPSPALSPSSALTPAPSPTRADPESTADPSPSSPAVPAGPTATARPTAEATDSPAPEPTTTSPPAAR